MSSFYITLFSDDSKYLESDTVQSGFTCDLLPSFDLRGSGSMWAVGLCELSTAPTCTAIYTPASMDINNAHLLGYTDKPSVRSPEGSVRSVPIDVGNTQDDVPLGVPLEPKSVAHVGDIHVRVMCDLISPQHVGKDYVPCLRTIIAPSQVREHRFQNVFYMPLEK